MHQDQADLIDQLRRKAIRTENDALRLNKKRNAAIMRGVPHEVIALLYGDPCDSSTKAARNLRDIEAAQRALASE